MINSGSTSNCTNEANKAKVNDKKQLVESLKVQWKLLWSERFDDKERAEGISVNDYTTLGIERGLIIHATRDFKALTFKEILEQKMIENSERYIQPDNQNGGWNKFIKKEITPHTTQKRKSPFHSNDKTQSKNQQQQPKKSGRGWLHKT